LCLNPELYSVALYDESERRFQSDQFLSVVEALLPIHTSLRYNSDDINAIELVNLPQSFACAPPSDRPINFVTTRYSVISAAFGRAPSAKLLTVFQDFDHSSGTSIAFDQECQLPLDPAMFRFVIGYEEKLAVVKFSNFSPFYVAKVIRSLLKHSTSLTTIVLEDYEDFRFEQLDFGSLQHPTVVTWHLSRLFQGNPERAHEFFHAFIRYPGLIQSLSISNVPFTRRAAGEFAQSLVWHRCFRSVECISLKSIEASSDDINFLFACFIAVGGQIKSLFRFSLGGWKVATRPLTHPWTQIALNSYLRCCHLSNLDMSQFRDQVDFGGVVDIEFASCKFSSQSLMNIFRAKSGETRPLTFAITSIDMAVDQWASFAAELGRMAPLPTIAELDWSGNPFPPNFEDVFIMKLLPVDSIRFLSLSRCFKATQVTRIAKILRHLKASRLWGLQIRGGDGEFQLGDQVIELVRSIVGIPSLEHVDLAFHYFSDKAAQALTELLPKLPLLHEVALDGTNIASHTALIDFYDRLTNAVRVAAVQVPLTDVRRLFRADDARAQSYIQALKNNLSGLIRASTRDVRVPFYLSGDEMGKGYRQFASCFPVSCAVDPPGDDLNVTVLTLSNVRPRTIRSTDVSGVFGGDTQLMLATPYERFDAPAPVEFTIPERVRRWKGVRFEPFELNQTGVISILERSKHLLSKSFLDVLQNIDAIGRVFQLVVDDPDPCEGRGIVPEPMDLVSPEDLELVRRRCVLLASSPQPKKRMTRSGSLEFDGSEDAVPAFSQTQIGMTLAPTRRAIVKSSSVGSPPEPEAIAPEMPARSRTTRRTLMRPRSARLIHGPK
jgi:hypothetical protein